jgi:mRNA-degrading endonuclease toxin of MazEF toxin-antitoxin module
VPRLDSDSIRYVVILSNDIHLGAGTGRVIVCPFIPGPVSDDATTYTFVVDVNEPAGSLRPELVHFVPRSALGEPIGVVPPRVLREAVGIVRALIS